MLDDTNSIFGDVHFTTGDTIEECDKGIIYNTGVRCEGEIQVVESFLSAQMNGNGIYHEFDLKFKFEGLLNKDDLVEGRLSSYYIDIEGLFDDFVFRKGPATLHFTDGYIFVGAFDNQGANGFGVLELPNG